MERNDDARARRPCHRAGLARGKVLLLPCMADIGIEEHRLYVDVHSFFDREAEARRVVVERRGTHAEALLIEEHAAADGRIGQRFTFEPQPGALSAGCDGDARERALRRGREAHRQELLDEPHRRPGVAGELARGE